METQLLLEYINEIRNLKKALASVAEERDEWKKAAAEYKRQAEEYYQLLREKK